MFDLWLLNKVNEVEAQTGQSLPNLLSQVSLGNVLTVFKELQITDLVEMGRRKAVFCLWLSYYYQSLTSLSC